MSPTSNETSDFDWIETKQESAFHAFRKERRSGIFWSEFLRMTEFDGSDFLWMIRFHTMNGYVAGVIQNDDDDMAYLMKLSRHSPLLLNEVVEELFLAFVVVGFVILVGFAFITEVPVVYLRLLNSRHSAGDSDTKGSSKVQQTGADGNPIDEPGIPQGEGLSYVCTPCNS